MNTFMIDVKFGDINGDGIIDKILLTGTKTPDSPFWQNITLVIQDGRTGKYQRYPLQENAGYNPSLFLGDFTGDKIQDILIVIDTGGSGGTIYSYVFSSINNSVVQIFNSAIYNESYKYTVSFKDFYKAEIISFSPRKRYIVDLQYKGIEYLNEVYNQDGTLIQPINGWVSPLAGLYPVDFDRDGNFELVAYQNIAGRYNADRIGYMENVLFWNGKNFGVSRQNVLIQGQEL